MKTFITIQAEGHDYEISDLEKKVKEEIKAQGAKAKSIQQIELYVQPLEGVCYFVANLDDNRLLEGQVAL